MPQEGAQLVADQNDEIGWHQNGGSETYLEILLGEFDQSDKQVGDWSIIATNVHRYTNYYFWTPQYYVKNTTGKTYRIMVREQTQSTQFLAGISGNFTVAVPKPREQGLPAYLSHPDYLSTLVPSPIQREVSLLPLFS